MKERLADPIRRAFFYQSRKARRRSDPAFFMYTEAKKRAKCRGLPFDLDRSDIIVPKLCPVFGVPLVTTEGAGKDFSPSIDAIIPSLGYIKGNIQIISNLANRMKNNASPEQLITFARWILSEVTEPCSGKHRQLKAVA